MEFLGLENDKKSLFTEMKIFLKRKQTFSFGQRRPLKNRINDISINSENLNLIEKNQNSQLPENLRFYNNLSNLRNNFKSGMDRIKIIAKKRLRYTFGCPKSLDNEMEQALEENYSILKNFEFEVQKVKTTDLSKISSKLINSIKNYYLQKLKKMIKKLKKSETEFYNKIKNLSKNKSSFDFINSTPNEISEKVIFSEKGEKMVLHDISKKEQNTDLIKMITKIDSLTNMLRDMKDMTYEQGVIVDRIDFNIELTFERTKKANEELLTAKEEMEKGCAAKLLKFLVIANMVLFFLLLVRNWV